VLFGVVGLVVVVVLGVGAAGAWWYVFGGSAPGKPHLSVTASTDVAPGTATPDGNWTIVPGKGVFVGYRMQEKFAADVIHKAAVGRTGSVTGTMTVASGAVTAATVTADLRTLSSDRAQRDNYIHTHALETDTYPMANFELAVPIALPSDARPGQKLRTNAEGRLTLHGVTRDLTVGLQARWNGSTTEVVGSAPIVLADYGIEPPNTSVVSVDDHGSFELQLTFRKTG
jgi:polyisoprenoid-binding protein YceI